MEQPVLVLVTREIFSRRFGDNTYIAGNFADVADFDDFYADLFANKKFVEECRFYDNGRLLTWLPYR